MLCPAALAALGVLVINDHFAKAAFPGFVTGKLSDAAGMVFFPLFLQGLWECAHAALGRRWAPSGRVLVAAAIATAFTLAAVKILPEAGFLYRYGWGAMQWPFLALAALVDSRTLPGLAPVALVQDATDVWTIPFAALSVLAGRGRSFPVPRPDALETQDANAR